MEIQFFSDPDKRPRTREDVRIKQVGIFVHDDGRKFTYGLELTPFIERPCIDVEITNADGQPAGALSVIETMAPNFSLVLHLRDDARSDPYWVRTILYYTTPESGPTKVDDQTVSFASVEAGEHLFSFEV
ncbi:MAG: hypothetical protein ACK2UK_03040 [Candidatus Promineifilaceae bacterium]